MKSQSNSEFIRRGINKDNRSYYTQKIGTEKQGSSKKKDDGTNKAEVWQKRNWIAIIFHVLGNKSNRFQHSLVLFTTDAFIKKLLNFSTQKNALVLGMYLHQ